VAQEPWTCRHDEACDAKVKSRTW